MYGGKILGGTSKGSLDDKGNGKGGHGGAVYVGGTMNMYGGSIEGGTALPGTKDGTAFGGKGGSLCVGPMGVLNMTGGTISGGTAQNGSTLDVLDGGVFNNNGGTVG
jgi:hypothetical protein